MRHDARAARLLNHLEELGGFLAVSVISLFEVLRGCRNDREEADATYLLSGMAALDVDSSIASAAATIMRRNSGVFSAERAFADALIAGTAVEYATTLVTLNTRQFARLNVPGLDLLLIPQDAPDWVAAVR